MMNEMEYYDAGIKVGKKYEQKRILRFLEERKRRNAKVVSISELTEFIEDGGRFQRMVCPDKSVNEVEYDLPGCGGGYKIKEKER